MLKLSWTQHHDCYNHQSELGFAQVVEVLPGKWRWEAHSNNQFQMMDMDGWWGTASTLLEAQLEAESELSCWS